ncbi:MAG: hypothetical protein WD054_05740, partial [Gemmatimonadota bacterium]
MTPSTAPLRSVIEAARRALRRDAVVAVVGSALCAVPTALLAAWLLGLFQPWRAAGFGPLVLDGLVVAGAAGVAWLGLRRWVGTLDERAIAADAERTAGMAEGSVRGVLELSRSVPEGTSAALARRAEAELGRRLAGISPGAIAAQLTATVRRRRRAAVTSLGVLSLATVLAAFAAPEHSRTAWAPLASPVRSLAGPALPALIVSPGDASVDRGANLLVHVTAPGREVVTVRWRMRGDVPRERIGTVSGDSAVVAIDDIDAPTEYWVEAPDGAVTGRFRITPSDPLLLSELLVDVVYPAHVGRPTDHFQGDVPPLEVPEGTQLVMRGRATRPLGGARLRGPDAALDLNIEGDRFNGAFAPRTSGVYALRLRDAAGADASVSPPPMAITVVRDAPPGVTIAFPARDTVLDATLRQGIVADARDDHGLASAALVSWRVSRAGQPDPAVEDPIRLAGDDRALIRALLDGSSRSLVPGDTLKFYVRVTDNSPAGQSAVSATIALRLPTMLELRDLSLDEADDLLERTGDLARTAAELRESTRTLERRAGAANARRRAEQQQAGRRGGSAGDAMDFEEASPSRQMLEQQERI